MQDKDQLKLIPEAYSEPCQTFNMELSPVNCIPQNSILYIWQGS